MPSAAFKDLCLDAVDRDVALRFWAEVLGGEIDARNEAVARIVDPQLHSLWFNTVPEPKVVKNRVHLDLYAPSVQPLLDLGATVYDDQHDFVVLRDPDGNELCVFPADDHGHTVAEVGLARPFALCVDSAARRRRRGGGTRRSVAGSATAPTAPRAGSTAAPAWGT